MAYDPFGIGTDGTGISQPTGGAGVRGWLSGIYNRLAGVVLAAGSALVGIVSAPAETSTIYNGVVALVPQFASVAVSSSGASTIVAAVGGKRIRVLALKVIANAAVNVKWQSHATPTDVTGLSYFAANGGEVLPLNQVGWFQTLVGEALDINLSSSVAVGGHITYVVV